MYSHRVIIRQMKILYKSKLNYPAGKIFHYRVSVIFPYSFISPSTLYISSCICVLVFSL